MSRAAQAAQAAQRFGGRHCRHRSVRRGTTSDIYRETEAQEGARNPGRVREDRQGARTLGGNGRQRFKICRDSRSTAPTTEEGVTARYFAAVLPAMYHRAVLPVMNHRADRAKPGAGGCVEAPHRLPCPTTTARHRRPAGLPAAKALHLTTTTTRKHLL